MNMRNVLWGRFQQWLSTLSISLFRGFSETGNFRHFSDYVFEICNFENTKSMSIIFLAKCSKFDLDFKNPVKNLQKLFYFRDNCIWIGIAKLPLSRTGYFWSAGSVLTSSPKIGHVRNRDFSQPNCLGSDQKIW